MGIGEGIQALWHFFCPPDPPVSDVVGPESSVGKIEAHMKAIYWWRVKISITLIALTLLAIAAAFLPGGVVTAGDMQTAVKTEVENQMKEMKAEQQQIKADVAAIKVSQTSTQAALNEILKTSIATNICRLVARRAKEGDREERAALRADIDKEQDKYRSLDGDPYPEARCGGGP